MIKGAGCHISVLNDKGKTDDIIHPAIILVRPQLGDNIGTVARAMLNFGLTDLRLVNPKPGWDVERARKASSGRRF